MTICILRRSNIGGREMVFKRIGNLRSENFTTDLLGTFTGGAVVSAAPNAALF